jgi:hypothetical protein
MLRLPLTELPGIKDKFTKLNYAKRFPQSENLANVRSLREGIVTNAANGQLECLTAEGVFLGRYIVRGSHSGTTSNDVMCKKNG